MHDQSEFFYSGSLVFDRVSEAYKKVANSINYLMMVDSTQSCGSRSTLRILPIEVMILDNQMPGMTGIDIITKLRLQIK
jgi:CheY-like chemotaxis protein